MGSVTMEVGLLVEFGAFRNCCAAGREIVRLLGIVSFVAGCGRIWQIVDL